VNRTSETSIMAILCVLSLISWESNSFFLPLSNIFLGTIWSLLRHDIPFLFNSVSKILETTWCCENNLRLYVRHYSYGTLTHSILDRNSKMEYLMPIFLKYLLISKSLREFSFACFSNSGVKITFFEVQLWQKLQEEANTREFYDSQT
jgi:hypothetical protein